MALAAIPSPTPTPDAPPNPSARTPAATTNDGKALAVVAAGAGEGIRTPDPLITNQLLYLAELRQLDETFMVAHTMPARNLACF